MLKKNIFFQEPMSYTFWCWIHTIWEKLSQYYSCWCPGSLRHQVISSHGVDWRIDRSLSSMRSFNSLRPSDICVRNLTIIGSDNGLLPGRHQAIICTNDGILLIGPLGTNFNEILIKILTFSFQTIHLKMSSGNGDHFCPGLNVLTACTILSVTE